MVIAESFHPYQIKALAVSGVDYLQVSTLSALPEAIGIALVNRSLLEAYDNSFMGGCCGTNPAYMQAIAEDALRD